MGDVSRDAPINLVPMFFDAAISVGSAILLPLRATSNEASAANWAMAVDVCWYSAKYGDDSTASAHHATRSSSTSNTRTACTAVLWSGAPAACTLARSAVACEAAPDRRGWG